VDSLPSKQELLAFQARWMRPAGIAAIVGALLFAVSLPLQSAGTGDNDAERLSKFHDHSTQLIFAQGVLPAIAFLLFTPLLYVLFKSAIGRTERIRRGMIVFAFIGPVLFALSSLFLAAGLNDVSGKFVDQLPAKEQQARERAAAAQAAAAKGGLGQQPTPAAKGQTTTTTPSGTGTAGSTTTSPKPQAAPATPRTPEQAASVARDNLANDLIDNSGLLQTGSLVRLIGFVSLLFAMIYIPLWAMRTGLLTRFWATLGMALAVSLLLVPFGIVGLVLWFAVIGLMLGGWWPRPLPPAWDAGEAIPWPRPGEDIGPPVEERASSDTVEGSGRELSEQRLPQNGGPEKAPEQPSGETPGQRRKKRKRRK
jgi:hypothetical protein